MDKSSLGNKFYNEILYDRCYCKTDNNAANTQQDHLRFWMACKEVQKRNEIVKDQDGQFEN